MTTKRALLIGINTYPRSTDRLKGAVSDATRARALFIEQFGFDAQKTRLLLNEEANRTNILDHLAWLCEGGDANAIRALYYSGHGSYLADQNGDEPDGKDECLVPSDGDPTSPLFRGQLIRDDEIAEHCKSLHPQCSLTLIVDACHSGTIQKRAAQKPFKYRLLHPPHGEEQAIKMAARRFEHDRLIFVRDSIQKNARITKERIAEQNTRFTKGRRELSALATRPNTTLLAACRADQKCAEALFGHAYAGVFTHHWLEALKTIGMNAPINEMMQTVRSSVFIDGFNQIPRAEGETALLHRPLFSPLP